MLNEEKLFRAEEAHGLLDVVKNYLLHLEGDLPARQRKGLGRLLDEILVSFDAEEEPAPTGRPQGDNVCPWPTLPRQPV